MDAATAIETLKTLLTPGTTVMTHVSGNQKSGLVLAFVKDRNNPMSIIPLNRLIEDSGLLGSKNKKNFTEYGYKTKTIGMDRGFLFVYSLSVALYGETGESKLYHRHEPLGWFLGG